MTHFGIDSYFIDKYKKLPCAEIDTFSLSLCRAEEQGFIRGCDALLHGKEETARRLFRQSTRHNPEFMDSWFMLGFMELVSGRAEAARQAFLHILLEEKPFFGFYVLRFLPTFRPHVNLFEDFVFHIMPTTGDVAAATARLYMIEKRNREAKKIIHPAFREYSENLAVQAVWGQSMIADDAPGQVIEEIDRKIQYHKGNHELDLLVTHVIGAAYFELDDFRAGVSHWESTLHHARDKNPRLIDRFRILLAKQYERRGFLIDAIEILGTVEELTMTYDDEGSVDFKRGQFIERIRTFERSGIQRPLRFHSLHEYPRWETLPKYLELHGAEG